MKLVERKGVLCYEYIDSFEKLEEKSLPDKEKFYSKLNDSHISDEDYEFAKRVWEEFDIETLGEYTDVYLLIDCLLLCDVFEQFRKKCHQIYGLDPARYVTSPSYSWDCMLRTTQVEIELITDVDMLLMIESGVRGGICQVNDSFAF